MMDSVQDPSAVVDMFKEWKNMGDNVVKSLMDAFSSIDSREKNLHLREEKLDEKLREMEILRGEEAEKSKAIDERERESIVVKGLLERRLDEVCEKLKEFEALRNGKLEEVSLREASLCKKEKEFELKNQKLVEELAVREESLCNKERESAKKLQQISLREEALTKLKLSNEKLVEQVSWRQADLCKKEKELEQNNRKLLEEISLREERLSNKETEFEEKLQQVTLKEEGLCKNERELQLGNKQLLQLVSLREEGLCNKERELEQKKEKLLMEVSSREESLRKREKEFELANDKLLEEVAAREENLCKDKFNFLNHIKLANEKLQEKQRMANALLQRLDCGIDMMGQMKAMMDERVKEMESREKMANEALSSKLNEANAIQELIEKRFKELEDLENQNQPQKLVVNEGQRTFQKDLEAFAMMFIHTKKDLEFIQAKIIKILTVSPEPVKLVLETVKECYGLLSGKKLNAEGRIRRGIVVVLDILTKMCPTIENFARKEAMRLASQWFSKLRDGGGDEMESLAFLHLVAAFDVSSHFSKKEMFRLLQMVGHEDKAELCLSLGLTKTILAHVHNLMSQKEYLVASIYIHEYELQHKLRQKTIINKYIAHSQKSAKAQATNQGNTYEAKEKAIAGEIADVRAAVAHVTKYGLEYPTKFLVTKIQQLEADEERLKQEKAAAAAVPNSRYDSRGWRGEDGRNSYAERAWWNGDQQQQQQQQAYGMGMGMGMYGADFSYPVAVAYGAPMPPNRPYKRQRPNDCYYPC